MLVPVGGRLWTVRGCGPGTVVGKEIGAGGRRPPGKVSSSRCSDFILSEQGAVSVYATYAQEEEHLDLHHSFKS